jgi:muramoyltetrapeptide carboxypeptidase
MIPLRKGDLVQIIAPSSRVKYPKQALKKVAALLESWGLRARISPTIFSKKKSLSDMANTDQARFTDLQRAILDPEVKAIWCIRGGYGAIRLITYLQRFFKTSPPEKFFIGFSDITTLHHYFHQQWQWRTLHASHPLAIAENRVAKKDALTIKQLLLGTLSKIEIDDLIPLNAAAKAVGTVQAKVVGGNLSTFSRSLGTDFSINYQDQILVIEDIEEPFRKIDGMFLQLLAQKQKPAAVILGDFSVTKPAAKKAIAQAIRDFVDSLQKQGIPVVQCERIGHGKHNHPVLLGADATLQLGRKPVLTIRV